MSATPIEVARDIVVAMINRQGSNLGVGLADSAAADVVKVFEKVFDSVSKKYHED